MLKSKSIQVPSKNYLKAKAEVVDAEKCVSLCYCFIYYQFTVFMHLNRIHVLQNKLKVLSGCVIALYKPPPPPPPPPSSFWPPHTSTTASGRRPLLILCLSFPPEFLARGSSLLSLCCVHLSAAAPPPRADVYSFFPCLSLSVCGVCGVCVLGGVGGGWAVEEWPLPVYQGKVCIDTKREQWYGWTPGRRWGGRSGWLTVSMPACRPDDSEKSEDTLEEKSVWLHIKLVKNHEASSQQEIHRKLVIYGQIYGLHVFSNLWSAV